MNSTETQLINILGQFLKGENPNLPANADLNSLFKKAGIHSLSAVVCYALNPQIIANGFDNKAAAKKLQKALFSTVKLQNERIFAFEKLLDILNDKGIRTTLMKGAVIKKYYPDDTIRTFGDIDFLISPNDRDALHNIMVDLGYDFNKAEPTVWVYVKGNEKYEVHTAVSVKSEALGKKGADFIDLAFSEVISTKRQNIFILNPSYHFAFLLLHLAKHMRSSGAGVRMYLDLALMLKNEPSLDFEKVIGYSKDLNLYNFLIHAMNLCHYWFETTLPKGIKLLKEENIYLLQEYVLHGGTFGFYERNPAAQRLRDEKAKGRLAAVLRYVFPPYGDIKNAYKFLTDRPYLLPLAWPCRWFDGIFLRRKKASTVFKGFFTEGDAAKATEQMLTDIGIENNIK